MSQPTILVNLSRCTGCWTCSLACKVAYGLAEDEWWQHVRTIGGGGIDEPAGTWPDLWMKWMPVYTQDCTLCGERTEEGLEPYCVHNCPTKALTFGDLDDASSPVSKRLGELKGKGYRTFRLAEWERTRPEVVYTEK
jgi:molybdopterin-containing oxidoreductase family iron-sulfur binding subunit